MIGSLEVTDKLTSIIPSVIQWAQFGLDLI